jgi:hypothetical protein
LSEYLDTVGNNVIGIGLCARCGLKFALDDLASDPNYPSLRCCKDDLDDYDPYRLPPRAVEDVTLEWPRPDYHLETTSVAPGSAAWPPSQFPDDGLQSAQKPSTGVIPFIPGQPVVPPTGETP